MTLTVGIAQIDPVLGDLQKNVEKYQQAYSEAKKRLVDVLVFPESSLTGYFLKDLTPEVAIQPRHPVYMHLLSMSRDLDIVAGFIEASPDHQHYIAAGYFSREETLHVHRKIYLPTYGMFDDKRYFSAGHKVRAFDTPHGRMAMLVCEDMWHFPASYLAYLDGAQILIVISSSPTRGVTSDHLSNSNVWERLNETLAHLFGVYIVFVNRVGYEDGVNFWGGSEVIDPNGRRIAKAKYFEEDFIAAEISPGEIRQARIENPLLKDENIDLVIHELQRIRQQLK